jgi:AcrR family transcriptional regulator
MSPDSKPRRREAHQLPPGRHGLSRTYVQGNQRQRILDAVADVASLAGYQAMSVEDIVGAAGVSRRTFYDNFRSKEDAFLTAFETIGAELVSEVQAAYDSSQTFPGGVIACLRVFLEFVASHPQYADACIVEVLAAGPAALERRNAVMSAMADLIHHGAGTMPNSLHPPRLTAETIVGGIYEIVYSRVLHGQTSQLPKLLADLAYSTMLPYLGHDGARQAMDDFLYAASPAISRDNPDRPDALAVAGDRSGAGAAPLRAGDAPPAN